MECGNGLYNKTGEMIKELGATRVLIITDKGVRAANLLEGIEKSLLAVNVEGIKCYYQCIMIVSILSVDF